MTESDSDVELDSDEADSDGGGSDLGYLRTIFASDGDPPDSSSSSSSSSCSCCCCSEDANSESTTEEDVDDGEAELFCDACDRTIDGTHYHCDMCALVEDEFDLCPPCFRLGVQCFNRHPRTEFRAIGTRTPLSPTTTWRHAVDITFTPIPFDLL